MLLLFFIIFIIPLDLERVQHFPSYPSNKSLIQVEWKKICFAISFSIYLLKSKKANSCGFSSVLAIFYTFHFCIIDYVSSIQDVSDQRGTIFSLKNPLCFLNMQNGFHYLSTLFSCSVQFKFLPRTAHIFMCADGLAKDLCFPS